MIMPKRPSLFQLVTAALAGCAVTLLGLTLVLHFTVGPQLFTLVQSLNLINSRFVGPYDPDQVLDSTMKGMVEGLGDRWSHYLTPEEAKTQAQRRENKFCGIGVQIALEDEEGLRILRVYDNSPASEAGLREGDLIIAVDGVDFDGPNRQALIDMILGEVDTDVVLTLLRSDGSRDSLTLTRAMVDIDPVFSRLLDNGVGYVALSNFYSNSSDRLNEAVDQLEANGATALIFDMRGNGGGYVPELTRMLDHLLPEGPIFRSVDVNGKEVVTPSDAQCVELPMAVLVNQDTYSAAEFFAAQLQETAGAYVVGEPTSGKGYSQQPLPLSNGGVLQISTGRYLTGEGVSLIGTGLTLDRQVSLPDPLPEELVDTQLNAALELLGYAPLTAPIA